MLKLASPSLRYATALVIAGAFPAATAIAEGGDLPPGRYECWSGSSARMLFNFEILGSGRYRDSEGATGTYRLGDGTVRFSGGTHDGRTAAFRAGRQAEVGFTGPSGNVVIVCQLVR